MSTEGAPQSASGPSGGSAQRRRRRRRRGSDARRGSQSASPPAQRSGDEADAAGAASRGASATVRQSGSSGGAARPRKKPKLTTVRETSAGGLVLRDVNGHWECALIGRLNRRGKLIWSMPKGHLEEGETAEQAAVREVKEETGIDGTILAPLGTVDFWFVADTKRIHKTVHHFVLKFAGGELCDDDIEVEEVAWVPFADLDKTLAYADERRLMKLVPSIVAKVMAGQMLPPGHPQSRQGTGTG